MDHMQTPLDKITSNWECIMQFLPWNSSSELALSQAVQVADLVVN